MAFYNDQDFCRQIIMENYDKPNKRIEQSPGDDFLEFNNNSDSCIDNITFYIKIVDNRIVEAYFSGIGCAISTSSSNIIANIIVGKTKDEAINVINQYTNMIQGKEFDESILNDLNVFSNISKQPNRMKCASIGSDACKKILSE